MKLSLQKKVLFLLALIIILAIPMAIFLPPAVDWQWVFRPAVLDLLALRSPFAHGYFNAPWALIPLIPIALLPVSWGRGLLAAISMTSFAWVAYKMKASPIAMALLLISPPVLHSVLNGNLEWLVVIGFILPPQIGLFFISIKPQMGIAIGVFWLIQSWCKGGWREAVRVFAPFSIALGLSIILWGMWPLRFSQELNSALWWNASLWPLSIPVGLALLVSGIRKNKIEYPIAASPCLSPYVMFHSWVTPLFAIVRLDWELAAAVVGLWVAVLMKM
jgi:hypothetical protein